MTWCYGHLVELSDAEDYDPAYKKWRLEHLPILPDSFKLRVVPRASTQLRIIERLSSGAPWVVNACDAGREGELIFGYVYRKLGLTQAVKRLWISSLTSEAIREGFRRLRPGEDFRDLYLSAECRSRGDWLTGINATRAFTRRFNDLLSIGRVQTPTLAMVVRREREIQAFRSRDYWEVFATFRVASGSRGQSSRGQASPEHALPASGGVYVGKWFAGDRPRSRDGTGADEDRLWDPAEAEEIARRVEGRPGRIEKLEARETFEKSPGLFDLTSLQRECNRRFGLTAAATSRAAQALYEAKLITYPRTDSRYLTRDLVPTLPRTLRQLGEISSYHDLVKGADPALVGYGNRRVVNDARVTDHHAIIPTGEPPGNLQGAAEKVYDVVARRFLAQFYPDAIFRETQIITVVEGERFKTHRKSPLSPGWTVVESAARPEATGPKSPQPETQDLPPGLVQGTEVETGSVEIKKRETLPPKRYTEGTLLAAMETAGREIEDDALREAMKQRGLGTPATRAAIIERLKTVGYLTSEKRFLRPSDKGCTLIDLAEYVNAGILLSPELTGEWEKRIADIQAGSYNPDRFLAEIRQMVAQLVEQVKAAPLGQNNPVSSARGMPSVGGQSPADSNDPGKCPLCGLSLIHISEPTRPY